MRLSLFHVVHLESSRQFLVNTLLMLLKPSQRLDGDRKNLGCVDGVSRDVVHLAEEIISDVVPRLESGLPPSLACRSSRYIHP